MKLALFDLDHTLLPIDSADRWSHYVVRLGGLDVDSYGERIREFSRQYKAGQFDVAQYVNFQLELLAGFSRADLDRWHASFMQEHVTPHIRSEALALIANHRAAGEELAIVTGTNGYVATPIARAFGIDQLITWQPEESSVGFSGTYRGVPTYREGKVAAVEQWLATRGLTLDALESSVFYSDSINDLPLLERVSRPMVTNGDAQLLSIAHQRGWETLQLFCD